MSFASKNRAAMAAMGQNGSGITPTVEVTYGPPLSTVHHPSVPYAPYIPPPVYEQPAPQDEQQQDEQQWIPGVPNVVTGLTAVAVAYAAYLAVTGEPRKNPTDDPNKPFKVYATPMYLPLESARFVASYATLAAATKAARRIAKERRGAATVESYSEVLHREDWHGVP